MTVTSFNRIGSANAYDKQLAAIRKRHLEMVKLADGHEITVRVYDIGPTELKVLHNATLAKQDLG